MTYPEYTLRSNFYISVDTYAVSNGNIGDANTSVCSACARHRLRITRVGILHDSPTIPPRFKPKLKLIAEEVLRFKPKIIVDIGYAQGPNIFLEGAEVYGVDLVSVPAPYKETYQCDLNTSPLPFHYGLIDAATMGCTLAHVANPLRVLAEINRILKPGGIVVVSSPNPNYYWETVLNIFYSHFKDRVSKAKHVEHFFEFSRYNMRTSAERAGFKVLRETGFLFALVKTPLRFNPINHPGMSYEIIYTLQKMREPASYTVFEDMGVVKEVETALFS